MTIRKQTVASTKLSTHKVVARYTAQDKLLRHSLLNNALRFACILCYYCTAPSQVLTLAFSIKHNSQLESETRSCKLEI